ncbi:HXXEE domain-containing protein [Actinomyces ruminis]|uniref:HXXEE domain-containing protein n=1 Tax=Actinomyces ruminis TaxID=1937003 RepID=A0ABX4M9D3_9ACTO|nr:HXXEE domain-containing protein [Actinomyces ruminis]PHP52058.1 HXXEE domain-containing protein [Actinomyces ruminis]
MRRPSPLDAATLGLAICYLLNDSEELATYRASSARLLRRAPRWVPLTERVRRDGWSQAHVNLAIALIGIHWVGASLAGYRSGGRSAWFQNAAAAWGLHGFVHLAACAAGRGYVSGALTAPAVIAYGAWARRTLRRAGVPSRVSVAGVAASLPVLCAAHTGAELLLAIARPASGTVTVKP